MKWDADVKTLSGKSALVVGDPYVLTVHLPPGFRLVEAVVEGESVEVENQKDAAAVRVVPSATKTVRDREKITFTNWYWSFRENMRSLSHARCENGGKDSSKVPCAPPGNGRANAPAMGCHGGEGIGMGRHFAGS